jgi:hypothetical protein
MFGGRFFTAVIAIAMVPTLGFANEFEDQFGCSKPIGELSMKEVELCESILHFEASLAAARAQARQQPPNPSPIKPANRPETGEFLMPDPVPCPACSPPPK